MDSLIITAGLIAFLGLSWIYTIVEYFKEIKKNESLGDNIKELKKEMNFRQTSFLIPMGFVEISESVFYKHFPKLQKGVRLYLDMEKRFYINETLAAQINQYEIEEEREAKAKKEPLAGLEDHIYTPIC